MARRQRPQSRTRSGGSVGRLDGASYRAIAAALFGAHRLPDRGWKTHDLRDRTIRLCKFGVHLMEGGYRQLLLHPYRQRLY